MEQLEQLAQRLEQLAQRVGQLVAASVGNGAPRSAKPMPRIQLLVIQPTPFCNIDCRYCYLPQRNSKAVVAEQTLANLFASMARGGCTTSTG